MGDILGYARVSTTDQNPELQEEALRAAGCIRVWTDYASGTKDNRDELEKALDHLRPGDTLAVWRIDRLGRSLPHLINLISDLGERGVQFRSITEGIDTNTPGGEFVFHILAALAQMERRLIVERTNAGLAVARENGRVGGRPTVLTPAKKREITRMYGEGRTVGHIVEVLGLSRSSVYRYLRTKSA